MRTWRDHLSRSRAEDAPLGVSFLKSGPASLASPIASEPADVNRGAMTVTCVLTTPGRDRQGDVVEPAGGRLDEHRSNPIVMFHHGRDYKLPIGKAEDRDGNHTVRLVTGADDRPRLVGTTHFSQSSPFANDVFGLIAEDIMRGVSVGFDPVDDDPRSVEVLGDSPNLDRPAMRFKAWNLLEYSHTPLGVNREALTVAVHKALDGSRKMHAKLLQFLTPHAAKRRPAVTSGFTGGSARKPVEKAMPMPEDDDDTYGDADQGQDADPAQAADADAQADPAADPQAAPGGAGDELTPAVKTCYDGAQAMLDICAHLSDSMKRSEHKDAKGMIADLCGRLQAEAQELKDAGDKIKAELESDTAAATGDGGDDAEPDISPEGDEADEPEEPEEPTPIQKDRTGAMILKGYSPPRWTLADLARATGGKAATATGKGDASLASRVKALEADLAEKDRELRAVNKEWRALQDDLKAASRLPRR